MLDRIIHRLGPMVQGHSTNLRRAVSLCRLLILLFLLLPCIHLHRSCLSRPILSPEQIKPPHGYSLAGGSLSFGLSLSHDLDKVSLRNSDAKIDPRASYL
ncbi:hypothetical protein F2Q69_00034696 [Brassica cretica]|uniref:Uncharacterized protein n=1 Tax=Brassica cretica TaxID=69181 RepID=A0A8S9SGZ1_BRACR|nr:hypothetical protein F2Q69_00034696 [Brassica cretica]